MNLKSLLFGTTKTDAVMAQAGEAALRAFAGLTMAIAHGWGKVPPPEMFVDGVGQLGFPAPAVFAWAASLAEAAGGLLMGLGLLTRPSSLALAFTMAVAAFGTHAADPFQKKEMALLYLMISLSFAIRGGGTLSLDALIRGKC